MCSREQHQSRSHHEELNILQQQHPEGMEGSRRGSKIGMASQEEEEEGGTTSQEEGGAFREEEAWQTDKGEEGRRHQVEETWHTSKLLNTQEFVGHQKPSLPPHCFHQPHCRLQTDPALRPHHQVHHRHPS